ncbi:hypothetical protein ACSBL2_24995 [Pedobacter sp. AW31-3R]|uniref:hypothetical protein n=1 Tax=Pedobacter sp. AW31-3R TaxID=3445781 RepID=UPI003FA14254
MELNVAFKLKQSPDCYWMMEEYKIKITNENHTTQNIVITAPTDDSGQYTVMIDGENSSGYIFVDGIDESGQPIWKGSNTILDMLSGKLGEVIQQGKNQAATSSGSQ